MLNFTVSTSEVLIIERVLSLVSTTSESLESRLICLAGFGPKIESSKFSKFRSIYAISPTNCKIYIRTKLEKLQQQYRFLRTFNMKLNKARTVW